MEFVPLMGNLLCVSIQFFLFVLKSKFWRLSTLELTPVMTKSSQIPRARGKLIGHLVLISNISDMVWNCRRFIYSRAKSYSIRICFDLNASNEHFEL